MDEADSIMIGDNAKGTTREGVIAGFLVIRFRRRHTLGRAATLCCLAMGQQSTILRSTEGWTSFGGVFVAKDNFAQMPPDFAKWP